MGFLLPSSQGGFVHAVRLGVGGFGGGVSVSLGDHEPVKVGFLAFIQNIVVHIYGWIVLKVDPLGQQ